MNSHTEFLGDLTRWKDRVRGQQDRLVRGVVAAVFNEISSGGKYGPGTPVDLGFARASWDGGVGAIPNNPAAGSEAEAQSRTLAAIQAAKAGDVIYLANNAPYITTLEFGGYPLSVKRGTLNRKAARKGKFTRYQIRSVGGYSYQAPQGFVRLVLAQAQAIVDEVGAFVASGRR